MDDAATAPIVLATGGNGGDVSLRCITKADAGILGAAFATMEPWRSYPFKAETLAGYFCATEPGAPRRALWAGDRLAGAVGLRLNWLRGPYVQFLGLLEDHQNRRLGSLVLEWIESEAKSRGDRNIFIAASDFNTRALNFYARHGFVLAAPLPDLVSDGKTELLLRKRIK